MSLTKDRRDALPETDFAVPGKRKLPIHDETHTRLAWDMIDRTQGLTSEEKTAARRHILTRAKTLGIDTKNWHLAASSELAIQAMAIEMPSVADHPNRVPFKGVLTKVDEPSDNPPGNKNGLKSARTVLPRDVAEAALPSLLGMAVDCTPGFDGHDAKNKIGLITAAYIENSDVMVEGFLYAKDFPDETAKIQAEKDAIGFSFELDARIQDLNAEPWVIAECVFTGAAILYKHLAAYTTTSIEAHSQQEIDMTKEELAAALAEAVKPVATAVADLTGKVKALEAKASLSHDTITQVKPHVDAIHACADAMAAAGIGTHSENGHVAHLRHMASHLAAEAVSGKTPHIYRDHDYLSPARVEAAAAVKKNDAATEELRKQLEAANATIADLNTKVADIGKVAFDAAAEAGRKTISPAIMSLLAKAGFTEKDTEKGPMSVDHVNTMLDAAGITGTQAIETKLKLREAGLMVAGKPATKATA